MSYSLFKNVILSFCIGLSAHFSLFTPDERRNGSFVVVVFVNSFVIYLVSGFLFKGRSISTLHSSSLIHCPHNSKEYTIYFLPYNVGIKNPFFEKDIVEFGCYSFTIYKVLVGKFVRLISINTGFQI